MRKRIFPLLVAATLLACESPASDNQASYFDEVEEWRAGRIERLMAPYGYINLVGLYWMENARATFGGDSGSELRFPGVSGRIGTFSVVPGGLNMSVEEGVDVRVEGAAVSEFFLPDDLSNQSITATYGTLAWGVVNRQGKVGIRLWDFDSPARSALPPIPYYAVDPGWRVTAKLRRYDEPKVMQVDTVIEGLGWNPESPGVVEFERNGKKYFLEAYTSGDRLFYVFGDRTNRDETYPAGRFLYSAMPGDDDVLVLDFNQAYNPPCVFNDFATCPVASPRNRLPISVTAGEKYVPALHVGSG